MGRVVALRIPGVTRKFIEQQVFQCRGENEAERQEIAATVERSRLLTLGAHTDGKELLDEVFTFIRRFVLLSEHQARVIALWILHTHAFEAAEHTPYLSINSPEKRSGKSRLLELLEALAARAWYTGRVSAAVLPRKIELEQSTLLLDESDTALNGKEDYSEVLRGILNMGHRRGGVTTVCIKMDGNFVPHDFPTFCPKAIAGIGKLPDTVADRSISICMKRKTKGEKVERFRLRDEQLKIEAERLHEQLAAYSAVNIEILRRARPELPDALSDRQQDGAEPLLAIADVAGGGWPGAARIALVKLCSEAQMFDDSTGIRLLSDIYLIFQECGVDRLFSADLTRSLAEIETSSWNDFCHGKPITQSTLAHLLGGYGIAPGSIRVEGRAKTAKGYYKRDFEDAWGRYLPQNTPSESPQSLDSAASNRHNGTTGIKTDENAETGNGTHPLCDGSESAQNSNKNRLCAVVPVSKARGKENEGPEEIF